MGLQAHETRPGMKPASAAGLSAQQPSADLPRSPIIDSKDDLPYHGMRGKSMATLTITAKGQITLKQELLQHMNVTPGQKVQIDKLPDGRLVVQPAVKTGSINDFIGSLEQKGGPRLTIAQIKKITEDAWAGKR